MRRRSSDRLAAGDRSLRAIALVVTWISMLLLLFPFVLTISNAMKDNVRIYDVPPGILPSPARSLSIVVDYDGVEAENLEAAIRDDMVSAMFGVYTRLSRSSIFETRFYGVRGGKTVFYARAHQIQLQMEKDYGIYKGTVLKPQTLLYRDRAERAARAIGYAFNTNGLADHAAPPSRRPKQWKRSWRPSGKSSRCGATCPPAICAKTMRCCWRASPTT